MLAAVLVVSSSLIAQESTQQREDPCNATESFSQFDFWMGEWTVTTADGRVRQFFEESTNGGESWTTWFEGFYTRQSAN